MILNSFKQIKAYISRKRLNYWLHKYDNHYNKPLMELQSGDNIWIYENGRLSLEEFYSLRYGAWWVDGPAFQLSSTGSCCTFHGELATYQDIAFDPETEICWASSLIRMLNVLQHRHQNIYSLVVRSNRFVYTDSFFNIAAHDMIKILKKFTNKK